MRYFSPEISKKLEKLGLQSFIAYTFYFSDDYWEMMQLEDDGEVRTVLDEEIRGQKAYSTLDICELENAKKLWGEWNPSGCDGIECKGKCNLHLGIPPYDESLQEYITLSDEERIKYVEDYVT